MTQKSITRGLAANADLPTIRDRVNVIIRRLAIGNVTLDSGDSTTVSDPRISGVAEVLLFPKNTEAALLLQIIRVFVSSTAEGSFVISHASAQGTEEFSYLALG